MPLGVGADGAGIDASRRELAGVADQPAFNLGPVGLAVKLQAEHVASDREGLVGAGLG